MNNVEFYIAFVLGMLLGNLIGDQQSIKDCATKNTANMMGGGTISCEVRKATPPSTEKG